MTSPAPSGGSSPLRIGGLALIGLGAVAALIGVASLIGGGSGGSGDSAAPAIDTAVPTSAVAPDGTAPLTTAPGATGPSGTNPSAAPGDSAVPVPSFGPSGANGAGQNGAGSNGAGQGGAAGQSGAGQSGGGQGGAGQGGGAQGGAGQGGSTGRNSVAGATDAAPRVAKSPLRVYNNSTITGLAARAANDFRAAGWPVDAVANYPQGVIPTTTVYYRPGTGEQSSADALAASFGMRSEPRFQGLDEATPGLIVIVTNDFRGK